MKDRKITVFGQDLAINPVADRQDSMEAVTAGNITPKAYWTSLRAAQNNMTDEEKVAEYKELTK